MISGKFPGWLLPVVGSVSAMFSIIICYWIAVSMGHEEPWPHCYISNTARHYPQFIFFRIATISGAVLLILTYFLVYFWLQTLCLEAAFNLHKYYPKIPLVLGIMGILYLFGSTATIDTGIMNMDLHVMCAGHFFILTIISCLYNTVVFVGVYRATKLITKASVVIKVTLSVLLIYQVYLSATKTAGIYAFGTDNSDLSHILEYTLAFSCLGYVLSYAYDLKDFKLAYRSVAK